MNNVRRKLLPRINRLFGAWERSKARIAWALEYRGLGATAAKVRKRRRNLYAEPGQWHRWYQANRRRQRQLSALKQFGHRIHPNVTSLKREDVR